MEVGAGDGIEIGNRVGVALFALHVLDAMIFWTLCSRFWIWT
jgi:hypothetical protein